MKKLFFFVALLVTTFASTTVFGMRIEEDREHLHPSCIAFSKQYETPFCNLSTKEQNDYLSRCLCIQATNLIKANNSTNRQFYIDTKVYELILDQEKIVFHTGSSFIFEEVAQNPGKEWKMVRSFAVKKVPSTDLNADGVQYLFDTESTWATIKYIRELTWVDMENEYFRQIGTRK